MPDKVVDMWRVKDSNFPLLSKEEYAQRQFLLSHVSMHTFSQNVSSTDYLSPSLSLSHTHTHTHTRTVASEKAEANGDVFLTSTLWGRRSLIPSPFASNRQHPLLSPLSLFFNFLFSGLSFLSFSRFFS